jgi:hypothetical protein
MRFRFYSTRELRTSRVAGCEKLLGIECRPNASERDE